MCSKVLQITGRNDHFVGFSRHTNVLNTYIITVFNYDICHSAYIVRSLSLLSRSLMLLGIMFSPPLLSDADGNSLSSHDNLRLPPEVEAGT